MQGKDKVSGMGLDARMMVAEKLVNSEGYEAIRDELRFWSTPEEELPSDASFRAYKETEEYRQIHLSAIANQKIGMAAIGVMDRLHDLDNLTKEAALMAIWRDLQDESLTVDQHLKLLDRLRGLQLTDARIDQVKLAEQKHHESREMRSLDLLIRPGNVAMAAARMAQDYISKGEVPPPELHALLSTLMVAFRQAINESEYRHTGFYPTRPSAAGGEPGEAGEDVGAGGTAGAGEAGCGGKVEENGQNTRKTELDDAAAPEQVALPEQVAAMANTALADAWWLDLTASPTRHDATGTAAGASGGKTDENGANTRRAELDDASAEREQSAANAPGTATPDDRRQDVDRNAARHAASAHGDAAGAGAAAGIAGAATGKKRDAADLAAAAGEAGCGGNVEENGANGRKAELDDAAAERLAEAVRYMRVRAAAQGGLSEPAEPTAADSSPMKRPARATSGPSQAKRQEARRKRKKHRKSA